jgi:hypothetical protein
MDAGSAENAGAIFSHSIPGDKKMPLITEINFLKFLPTANCQLF